MKSVRHGLMLLSVISWLGRACAQRDQHVQLQFSFFTSFGGGFISSGSVPAVGLALQQVASQAILPGYTLNYVLRDSMCDRTQSLDVFFQEIQSEGTPYIALLGCGCSTASEPVAEVIHHWNISQISYASSKNDLSNRQRFPNFFRTYANFVPSVHSLMQYYGWERLAVITEEDNLFLDAFTSLRVQLEQLNITVANRTFPTGTNPLNTPDLFFRDDDYRVIFLNTYSSAARTIICEAARSNYTYPRYAWLTYGWYRSRWWTAQVADNEVPCSDDILTDFLERSRAISLQSVPTPANETAVTDTGISSYDFYTMYKASISASGGLYNYSFVASLAYDAVWTLAFALNSTMEMVNAGDISRTGCDRQMLSGELVPLERFNYSNALMGCVMRWNIQQTNFSGVSGQVAFDENGSRLQTRIAIEQYRERNGLVEPDSIGFITNPAGDGEFQYTGDESNQTVYPSGIPPDGTPRREVVTYHLALVVTYDFLAAVGIAFTVVCLVFNFAFRKRKIVRLTSPNLNYFIIAGAFLLYGSIFVRLIPSTDRIVNQVRCSLRNWMEVVGYCLAYGTILAKMGRIYQIFHNPTPAKKGVQDWHLVLVIVSITGVGVLLLFLEDVVPLLRPNIPLLPNLEDPQGNDVLGVRIDYVAWQCFDTALGLAWLGIIFVYLAILQLVGIVLAFQTRKVKIKMLNDAKYIAAIIYISSLVLVVLIVGTVSPIGSYINVFEVVLSGGILAATTVFEALIFIPKMVYLYRDPAGEKIFDKSYTKAPSTVETVVRSGVISQLVTEPESEQVTKLQNRIKELERELANAKSNLQVMDPETEQVTKLQKRIKELERKLANSESRDTVIQEPRESTVVTPGDDGIHHP